MITVAVVDDERLVLSGFAMILTSDPQIEVIATSDGPGAAALLREHRPDVLLLDIHMPRVSGLEVLHHIHRTLRAEHRPRVLMLTTFATDDATIAALELGASGFLLKDLAPRDLISCVHQVAAGRTVFSEGAADLLRNGLSTAQPTSPPQLKTLSAREREVLALLGAGLGNSEIAGRLSLSAFTVKDHVSRILEKTGTGNRTQAAILAVKCGLVRGDGA